jgi:hypothetical protein
MVIRGSLVAFLANSAPEAALWIHASDPQALVNLAERSFDPARTPAKDAEGTVPEGRSKAVGASGSQPALSAKHSQVGVWAETALISDSTNARALRILGQLAEAAGDKGRATNYMQAAVRHSIYESTALSWLLQVNYEKKDYGAALYFADALLRTRSQAMPHVLPTLGRLAEDPAAIGDFQKLLASNPPWRRRFLSALPRAVSDARTPLKLLLALRETPSPPSLEDIRDYVNLLVEHKFYELAYYSWLQFLPPGQLASAGYLFNGSFEIPPSGLPFDWVIGGGTGVTVDIVPRTDAPGQRALFIELGPGRVQFDGVVQTVLLGPGNYQFKGKYRGEVIGPRGLVWRIACAGGAVRPIGQSAMMMGVVTHWKDIGFSFTVPRTDCRAQQLRLVLDARMASEQLVSGSVWYDELGVSRDN